jgi:chitinase
VDQGQTPRLDLVEVMRTAGVRLFTLAFIRADGCSAAWSGYDGLDSRVGRRVAQDIAAVREAGGDVIISFGGSHGTELARVCTREADLLAQYESVITTYDVKALDFDIEGSWALDRAANDRRSAVIAELQAKYPDLRVSFTVETGRQGFGAKALGVLNSAIAYGVRVSRINLMTMYFNAPRESITDLAMTSVEASAEHLAEMFPERSAEDIRSLIGITPLIGRNPNQNETFSYADAVAISKWAREQNYGLLSMWSLHRDRSCVSQAEFDRDVCSGLQQSDYDYSWALARGHG